MFSNVLFRKLYLYEIMWKNIAKPGRPQTTVWRMRFAWWIPESTNIHSEYVIVVAFPQQQLLHERTPM